MALFTKVARSGEVGVSVPKSLAVGPPDIGFANRRDIRTGSAKNAAIATPIESNIRSFAESITLWGSLEKETFVAKLTSLLAVLSIILLMCFQRPLGSLSFPQTLFC